MMYIVYCILYNMYNDTYNDTFPRVDLYTLLLWRLWRRELWFVPFFGCKPNVSMNISIDVYPSYQSNTLSSQLRVRSRHRGTLTEVGPWVAYSKLCVIFDKRELRTPHSIKLTKQVKPIVARMWPEELSKFVTSLFDDHLVSEDELQKYKSCRIPGIKMQLRQ